VHTATLDGSIIACVARLEYHCADRVPDCGHFVPADHLNEDAAED
jgi:hypothetical protein